MQNVIGHESIKGKLSSLLLGDPSGTYLFYGPPSVGKRTTAFEFAKSVLCEKLQGNACTCRSCRKFGMEHPDFLCVGWHEKIKVADVDQLLDFSFLSPLISDRKVIVIDNADVITWEAADRLLKILEEPPPKFTFILVSSNPQALVPTILYRCIRYEFGSLSKKDLETVIIKKLGFDAAQARILSNIAAESSLDVFSKAGYYIQYRDMAFEFIGGFQKKGLIDLLDFIDKVDRSDMSIFSDMVLLILTDILLIQNGIPDIVNVDLLKGLTKISGVFSDKAVIGVMSIFSQVKRNAYLNVNMSLNLKNALIKSHPYAIAGLKAADK